MTMSKAKKNEVKKFKGVRFTPEYLKAIEAAAKKENRSATNWIETVVKQRIDDEGILQSL